MARGCPCIGTAVGGIPELLEPADLVPAGNAGRLAESIMQVVFDSQRLLAMSVRNMAKSEQFTRDTGRGILFWKL